MSLRRAITSASSLKRNSGAGAERLFFDTLALAGVHQNGRLEEVAAAFIRYRRKPRAPFYQRIGNMLFHFCLPLFIDQRPDGDAFIQPVADVQFAHRLLQFFSKAVIHAVLHV